jgi:hypothetical protein
MRVEVETWSGYKADERPCRFAISGVFREVVSVQDRWYGPDDDWFRVRADDGHLYVLRHSRETDVWTLDAFRSQESGADLPAQGFLDGRDLASG